MAAHNLPLLVGSSSATRQRQRAGVPATHHVDAAVVGRVQLQHRLPEAGPQQLVGQAQDAGGLACAGRALQPGRHLVEREPWVHGCQ